MEGDTDEESRRPMQPEYSGPEFDNIWRKCEVVIEEASNQAAHFREQGAALLRWSITTCLTINAGALVATMNATTFDPRSRLWSSIWFLLGVLVALLVGAILASAFLKIASNHTIVAKEMKVALRTKDPEKIMSVDTAGIGKGESLGGFGFFLSVLSVCAFVVGACIMIDGSS